MVRWRTVFYKETIKEEDLNGIAVFARGKVAQLPFFFEMRGGLGAQQAMPYLSGRVEADYLDELEPDLIATERQRLNWEHPSAQPLLEWGQQRTQELMRIWQKRRREQKIKRLEARVSRFSERLDRLPTHERKTVRRAVDSLANMNSLTTDQLETLAESVLDAWDIGRLRELISALGDSDELDEASLVSLLVEANVITALQVAESVRTKIGIIDGLRERVERRELENAVRDYIAENPWLVSPEWETFQKERSVRSLLSDTAAEVSLESLEGFRGRTDLSLSSGERLLILEFMRPSLKLDQDHLDRWERYVREVTVRVRATTASPFRDVTGFLIADELHSSPAFMQKLDHLAEHGMHALDWAHLLDRAESHWSHYLDVLGRRGGDDIRLKRLTEGV